MIFKKIPRLKEFFHKLCNNFIYLYIIFCEKGGLDEQRDNQRI